ncbi:hypothetical protein [Candidatus Nitrosopumilus sediminis]|uniref:Uncharacterized protein n=1 Tax=Candidatus Nitrosopumilus sediminis TaxID=1229909 RepID=K0BAT7_9ARCH|nr:hypothetical protein [Candidatus Nitrosopumilus sediminis]AFS82604.1 hypothetical protein NSED_03990 [Candidatus Nitrosopumilus sediminis]
MKTRLLIIIVMISITSSLIVILPNYWLEFDDFGIFLCDRWFDSHYTCNRIWLDPDCNRPGGGCIFPEKSPYDQFLEKKATMAFNLKLDDYRITSKVQNVYQSYSTGIYKSFLAIADGKNSTQYYLATVFDPDESLDNIDVEIYEIISDKCSRELIYKGNGCELKYLEKIVQPIHSSLDYGWITGWDAGEDYCFDWCDQKELFDLGCNQSILAHLTKYSNLLDEEFDGEYSIEDIGLPDGVTQEKFEWCVDFIYEKRIGMDLIPEKIVTG